MKRESVRVYADTSVFGGVFDTEFARASRGFFDRVRAGRIALITSALVEEELAGAPLSVRGFFSEMLPYMHRAPLSTEAIELRSAYISAEIVTPKSATDVFHVAVATVNRCPVLVSWNCRHIVHFRKIPMYNAVNRLHGLPEIAIHTPLEVLDDQE